MHYLDYVIKTQDHGREVLSILRGELKLSTHKIRSVKWEEKGILLDGIRVTVRQRVRQGQKLQILLNDSMEESHIAATPMDLSILYEDENLIFLEKPSGIVSHPSMGHSKDSLANGLASYYERKKQLDSGIHLIGRLDKDTSGIVGIAKNSVTKDRMIHFRKQGHIRKEYLALVEGKMKEKIGVITHPMVEYRDEKDGFKIKMRSPMTGESGLFAVTHYEVIAESHDDSLLLLWLETGRMHQIRFHMASIGHPLLGDSIYGHGSVEKRIERTALHAWKLRFLHPYHLEEMELISRIPEDMAGFIPKDILHIIPETETGIF